MPNKEHRPLSQWFGEKRIVRLMLLAALLILGVIHVEFIVNGIFYIWNIAKPLIVGAALAYILEIIIKRLERIMFPRSKNKWIIHSRRFVCILLAMLMVGSLLTLIIAIVIPGLAEAFTLLARELPNYFTDVKAWVMQTFADVPTVTDYVQEIQFDWATIQDRVINWAINGIGGSGLLSSTVSVIGAVTGSIANIFISIIFALFLLSSKDQLHSQFHRLLNAALKKEKVDQLQVVMDDGNRCFSGFIIGQTLNGLILGIFTWLGMRIFRMPYALIVAVLSGTTSLIPIIGGYIGAAAGTFLVFTAAPEMALWFLLFIVALQTVQGNVVYPRLVGSSVGLPSLWVLAAVSIGGGLGGIAGMLVAVPITATAYSLITRWVRSRERQGDDPPKGQISMDQLLTQSKPSD